MKKTIQLTLLSSLFLALPSFTLMAMPKAPIKDVEALKVACEQIAQEDQLPDAEIPTFLLDCVNDQLTERGYARIDQLDGVTPVDESKLGEKSLIEALEEEN